MSTLGRDLHFAHCHKILLFIYLSNSLLVSCGGLTPDAIKTWVELDALAAITSALEAHSVFEGGGDEDVLPAMLFGLATPLLIRDKDVRTAAAAAAAAAKEGHYDIGST